MSTLPTGGCLKGSCPPWIWVVSWPYRVLRWLWEGEIIPCSDTSGASAEGRRAIALVPPYGGGKVMGCLAELIKRHPTLSVELSKVCFLWGPPFWTRVLHLSFSYFYFYIRTKMTEHTSSHFLSFLQNKSNFNGIIAQWAICRPLFSWLQGALWPGIIQNTTFFSSWAYSWTSPSFEGCILKNCTWEPNCYSISPIR